MEEERSTSGWSGHNSMRRGGGPKPPPISSCGGHTLREGSAQTVKKGLQGYSEVESAKGSSGPGHPLASWAEGIRISSRSKVEINGRLGL